MRFIVVLALILSAVVAHAEDTVLTDSLDIMQFLTSTPEALQNPLAIQLSRGETVKVTAIKYVTCSQGSKTSMTIEVSNTLGKILATTSNIPIPCPK